MLRRPSSALASIALPASLALASLVGCGGGPNPEVPPSGARSEPSAAGAPAPVGSPSASAAAPTTPVTPAAASAPAESPFVAIAQHSSALRLFPVDGAVLVLVTEPAELGSGLPMGVLEGDSIQMLDRLTTPGWFATVIDVQGQWPSEMDLLQTGSSGRTGIAEHYVLTPIGWKPRVSQMGNRFVGMARLAAGTIGITAPLMFGAPTIETLRGNPGPRRRLTLPPPECLPDGLPAGAWGVASTAVSPAGVGATRAGRLVSVGKHCDGDTVMETWAPGATQAVIVPIPGVQTADSWESPTRVVTGVGPDDAWVLGGYVAHVVGEKVEVIEDMLGTSGGVAADGTVWTLYDGRVYKLTGEGVTEVPAPAGATVDDLAVGPDGTVWMTGNGAVFRLRRPGEAGHGVAIDTSKKLIPNVFRLPRPGGPSCATNLVVLYGFTKVTPVDYDFPLTRKALKGHTEFHEVTFAVTEDAGRRFLTGAAPDFETAKKLMSHIESNVQGAKPTVVCATPRVVREFPLNLYSGELDAQAP